MILMEVTGMSISGVMASVLMYADGLVLLAQNEVGLQRGINVLHGSCRENNLTVNTSNSNLMYVSKRK